MENLNYIIGIIAGVITIAGFIAGIRYFRPKSISQKTNIKGDGNTVNNSNEQNESHDGHAMASGQGNITIGKAQNVSINQDNSNVQMPIEEFKRRIELERNDAVEKYKKANNDEKPLYLRKITEFDKRLANLPKYLQDRNELIRKLKDNLEVILEMLLELAGNEILVEKLTIAKADLEKGYLSKTDDFLAELEVAKIINKQTVINIAFRRGKIAEHEVRWHDATEHYARAAQLDPCYETLMNAQAFACNIGDYSSALSLGENAKKVIIKEYGKESKEYAICLANIGGVYLENKDYKKAEPFFNNALDICKKVLGEKDFYTASIINNLGGVYKEQGQNKKAKQYYQKALDIYKELRGKFHPDTAVTLSNIARLYQIERNYKKAALLNNEALEIRQKNLDKNHPDIANSFNNIGGVYLEQKQYEEAALMFHQALEIFEITLGAEHRGTKLIKKNYETAKENAQAEKTTPQ